jgi:hypothetical protein
MPKGGKRPGAGRPKGAPNKLTRDLKEAILGAFEEVGGQSYLEAVAREDMRTFCTLLGKVLPTTIAGDPKAPVGLQIISGVPRASDG